MHILRNPSRDNGSEGMKCFRCHKRGHFARNCPQSRPGSGAGPPDLPMIYLKIIGDTGRRKALLDTGANISIDPLCLLGFAKKCREEEFKFSALGQELTSRKCGELEVDMGERTEKILFHFVGGD